MIKIENVVLPSPEQWKAIIMGARNPLNSWSKSDSRFDEEEDFGSNDYKCGFNLGNNDYSLMTKLAKAGTDHRKFMRMITVYADITAPLYWIAEFDTYKVGTVRNSCSFMHKGVSKPFEISDFSIKNDKIYKILTPLEKKTYELEYPYETDEFKIFTDLNGRTYKVYRNGLVVREGFEYTDNYGSGRTRYFDEQEATVYRNGEGYFIIKLSGRNGGHMLLHRLVATMWCEKPDGCNQVNHIDGNKGNNCAENLEWVTAKENVEKAVFTGLYSNLSDLRHKYLLWKESASTIPIEKRMEFKLDYEKGMTHKELAEKYGITPKQANNVGSIMKNSENEDTFQETYVWDKLIEQLNYLRSLYLETKDSKIFQEIRCLLPQGYMQRSTFMLNYEVLANMYNSRKNHKLDEWKSFCEWIETLPYSEMITGKENI